MGNPAVRFFILLLLASAAFAEFQLQNLDVSIKMNADGSAAVEERINLIIFGQYSRQLYESGFNTNTLSKWQEISNITEIKIHISARSTDIRNVLIRPQPLQRSLSLSDVWYGQIILSYSAYPYYDADGKVANSTGIVLMDKYKPRTTRYVLNDNSLNFARTETGAIKLDEVITLSITPPQNAMITYVNPITSDMHDANFPALSRTLEWSGLTLVQFSLEYEVEQTLDKEVVQFFSDVQQNIRVGLLSSEGIAALTLAAILVLSYFYLRISRR